MKLFLAKLAAFLLLQFSLLALVGWRYAREYNLADSYIAATIDKHALLRTQAPPRMIFVGGSATAFGLDSETVARRCGFHSVNMGLTMFLGLDYMLNEVEPDLRPGDVVVVTPEYDAFHNLVIGNSETLWRAIEAWPPSLRFLSWDQLKLVLDRGLVTRAGGILRRTFSSTSVASQDLGALPGDIYRRSSFAPSGDMAAHRGMAGKTNLGQFGFKYHPDRVRYAVERLNRFHSECTRRGVRVYFSHSPLAASYFQSYRDRLLKLEADLQAILKVPTLDTQRETIYEDGDFFDTAYHLNVVGSRKRSQMLAERLVQRLGVESQRQDGGQP